MNSPGAPPAADDLTLLRILCGVAWADGEFSAEEKELLDRLVRRYLAETGDNTAALAADVLAATPEPTEGLERLLERLGSNEDRQLIVKLAYMMIRLGGHQPGDSGINASEKRAYRLLVEGSGLNEREIEAAEWAGEQELAQHSGVIGLLRSRFAWLGG